MSEWRQEPGLFRLRLRVPIGATAIVFLPAKAKSGITETGKPIESAPGLQFLRMENGKAVLAVASGEYHLTARTE